LLVGLETANMSYIQYGCDDVLHQPYRFKLIEDIEQIQKQINADSALYLSGAGPTLAIISKAKVHIDLTNLHSHWNMKELQIDTEGTKII
jgi:threonine synthase